MNSSINRSVPRAAWLALALAGMLAVARGESVHVFLIGGQSNADGRAALTGLPSNLAAPQNDVPFYVATSPSKSLSFSSSEFTVLSPGHTNTKQFGPELTFGRAMADYYEKRGSSIAIIKYANGGTNLAVDWKAGGSASASGDGPVYQNFHDTVTKGLAAIRDAKPGATITLDGMIWMQGESDANKLSAEYQKNLTAFISDIRQTYGAHLPFVIGELSTSQTGTNNDTKGGDADRNAVRAAQESVHQTVPFTGLVNTDSFGLKPDHLHFDNAGQQALGSAFAAQMQALVSAPQATPSPGL